MKRIAFDTLKRFKERNFVFDNANLEDESIVKSFYVKLLDFKINSDKDFNEWFVAMSELEIALDELASKLYIEMTCQTDDVSLSSRYKKFIENVLPCIKEFEDILNKRYLKENESFNLEQDIYGIYNRDISSDIGIFIKENIDLETKVQLLAQEYQEISGSMTINLNGEEKTLVEASKLLLNPDRDLRQSSWEAISEKRLESKDKINDIFNEMMSLRNQIARNAGCNNFSEYKFKELHRFDYSIDKCKEYHAAIEDIVVPLWKDILKRRKDQMGLDLLKPWDTAVDPLGLESLQPFEKIEDLVDGCTKILTSIDKTFGLNFSQMAEEGYLDLENRKGKAPGGYQSSLNEARKPFIFMNAVGTDSDVKTLLHESGHAMHSILCSNQPILHYLHAPMEFCEVASMSMEMLSLEHLSVFYENKEDENRSIVKHLEDVIFVLVWVATIDAFQFWIYDNPNHSSIEREEAWLAIRKRFAGDFVDWSEHDQMHRNLWHKQLHIFEVPFYYIEYGIAQLGALQVWLNSKRDYSKTITDYKNALSLGGSNILPELFKTSGLKFDFSKDTIKPLVQEVKKELEGFWSN